MLRLALIVFAVLWLAPALLVTAGGASPLVFLVLLAILGFYYGRSRGDWGSLAAQLSSGRQAEREPDGPLPTAGAPALVASGSERLRRRVERLEDRRSELIERLPADPLDCQDLVSCLAVLTHEPAGERDRVEEEYRGFALRLADWSADLSLLRLRLGDADGLAADPRLDVLEDEAEQLEAEVDEIAAYVHGLAAQAEEAEVLPTAALDAAVRAGEALDRARAALEASSEPPAKSRSELEEAAVRLDQAWRALEQGRERPRTALRLAGEVGVAAAALEERLRKLADLPADVERVRRAFAARHAETGLELREVRERFETVRQSHPESSWSEIEGIAAEAGRELDRAVRLWRSATEVASAERAEALETIGETQREALAALDEAAALLTRITAHLDRLERAALDGRDRLLAAEKEIDRAWAKVAGREGADGAAGLLGRATKLAREARSQLDRSRPDWLEVSELADRSYALARRARAEG